MEIRVPTRSAGVALQQVGQEAILYDRQHGQAHVINISAVRIWELCDGRSSLDEIAGAFAASYGLPVAAVHGDVVKILTTFRELRVLE
jgi:pyrroloquinoline quinone biosynthesis protein D